MHATSERPPEAFSGVAVYFTTGIHSVRAKAGHLTPGQLLEVMANVLSFQQTIIERSGGVIEQFVGDAVSAYWRPSDLPAALGLVCVAARRIVAEKAQLPELDYRLAIHFCAADLAGGFFGPPAARRFQVLGAARSRVDALPRYVPGRDCVFTDAPTVAAMFPDDRAKFDLLNPGVYALRIPS